MIEVERLSKRFGPVTAVDDLSFTVRPGRVTGFLGPNGAGKTTTMRIILGPGRGRHRTGALVGGRRYDGLIRPLREVGSLLDATALHAGRTGWAHLLSIAQSNGISQAARHRGAAADRARIGGPAPGRRLLARHEAAARHRRRAARRPAGADVRRAGQRPGPGGHPLDPRVLPRAGRRRPHRPGLQPPDERDGADRRPPGHHRPRPAARRRAHRGADRVQRPPRRAGPLPAGGRTGRADSRNGAGPSPRRTTARWS